MLRTGTVTIVIMFAIASIASSFDLIPGRRVQAVDEYLQLRTKVLTHLQQQHDAEYPGTHGPGNREHHIAKTDDELEQDRKGLVKAGFRSRTLHQWFVNIDDEALATGQGNSETMLATQLLHHYCGGLKELGFRNNGSSGSAVSATQCAANDWFREGHADELMISAVVFVAPAARQAIVRIEIRESGPKSRRASTDLRGFLTSRTDAEVPSANLPSAEDRQPAQQDASTYFNAQATHRFESRHATRAKKYEVVSKRLEDRCCGFRSRR